MWTLRLIGGCTLTAAGQSLNLRRKPAALLAYLALEGPTPRARLAELLWPELDGKAQRNNLRQVLFQLRRVEGLFRRSELLELGIAVDVHELTAALKARQPLNRDWLEGTLLGGFEYDDCPDFAEWLQVERERLLSLRLEALEGEAERLEREGHLVQALGYARRLVEADPVSETAYRRLMRLHYLLGDRAAALRVYARAQETLRRELGVDPLPQTTALAQAIERDAADPAPPAPSPLRMDQAHAHPLVGREREWAALETAWAQGRTIVVRGAPGVGKSRLLREFTASKGPYALHEARPGDRAVPYAAYARFVRESLEARPEQLADLEPWARRELARLLPGVFAGEDPPPLGDAAARLRFFQAIEAWVRREGRDVVSILIDDLQYHDPASAEIGQYLISSVRDGQPRLLAALRAGESPEFEGFLANAVRAGMVTLIHLDPLDQAATERLVESLVPDQPGLGARLYPSTGGNPFFVIETLRAMAAHGDWTAPPPLAEQVSSLLEAQLNRLSPEARRLAALVGVAGEDYTPMLAAQALETLPRMIAEWEGELEANQVLRASRFTHDLMGEAVLRSTPPAVRRHLHTRLAEILEGSAINPARLADHWMQAGQSARAWEPLLKAAEAALEAGALTQAQEWLERLFREAPPPLAQRAGLHLGVLAIGRDAAQAEALLLRVVEEGDPFTKAEARAALAQLYAIAGRPARGLEVALEAQANLPADAGVALRARLFEAEFQTRWRMGDLAGAEGALRQALAVDPDPERAVSLGLLLWSQGQYREEIQVLEGLLQRRQGSPWLGVVHNNLAFAHFALGELDEAIAGFERALAMGAALGDLYDMSLARLNLGTVWISRGEYRRALELLEKALEGYNRVGAALGQAEVHSRLGLLHARLGRWPQARHSYDEALRRMRPIGDPFRIAYVLAGMSEAQVGCGEVEKACAAAEESLEQARQAPQPYGLAYALMAMSLVCQRGGAGEEALSYAAQAVALSERFEMAEQLARALIFLHDAKPDHPQAKAALRRALAIAQRHDIPDLVWRAARRLGRARQATEALARLEAAAPVGWMLRELA